MSSPENVISEDEAKKIAEKMLDIEAQNEVALSVLK